MNKQVFKCKDVMETQRAAKKILMTDKSTIIMCKIVETSEGYNLEVTTGGDNVA